MTHIQLKSDGGLHCYTVYTSAEVKQILDEIKKKCGNNDKFNYIKRLAGFKNEYLVFLDDIYNFMFEVKHMNDIFTRPASSEYIAISNKGVLSGQVQTVAKLFNRTTVFYKAIDSIMKLEKYNEMLNRCKLVKDGNKYIFVGDIV